MIITYPEHTIKKVKFRFYTRIHLFLQPDVLWYYRLVIDLDYIMIRDIEKDTRRKLIILWVFVAAVLICCITGVAKSRESIGLININPGGSYIKVDDIRIMGHEGAGCVYFFFPSYISIDKLDYSDSEYKLVMKEGGEYDTPILDKETDVFVHGPDGEDQPYRVGFYKSENLYTVEIQLGERNIEDIEKETYIPASVNVMSAKGRCQYRSKEIQIKGHGNTSWHEEKKPYEIKLPQEVPLCDMSASDKWTLLSNHIDNTKLLNKLAFDFSSMIGMEYSIEADWVDLYIDDVYMGNYLLCHEPDIGKNDLNITDLEKLNKEHFDPNNAYEEPDSKGYSYNTNFPNISGGYLLEANVDEHYDERNAGFRLESGKAFTLKSPKNASKEEVDYIAEYVRRVEDDLVGNIDMDSFSKRFFVHELFMNHDTAITSYYFYKKPDDPMLYAGPTWDFDKTCGYIRPYTSNPVFRDYTAELLDILDDRKTLEWDYRLAAEDDYLEYMKKMIVSNEEVIDELINDKIDEYYYRIIKSISMDRIRWDGNTRIKYNDVNNDIRYLKFFLYHRAVELAEKYGTDICISEPELNNDEIHTLSFEYADGSTYDMTVRDGAQLTAKEMPANEDGSGGIWYCEKMSEVVTYYLPIYEDMTLTTVTWD